MNGEKVANWLVTLATMVIALGTGIELLHEHDATVAKRQQDADWKETMERRMGTLESRSRMVMSCEKAEAMRTAKSK